MDAKKKFDYFDLYGDWSEKYAFYQDVGVRSDR